MATMRLFLLPLSLTLLSVAAEDEEALAMPDTVYRAATFPATTEKLLGKWYITRWAGNLPIPAKKKLSPLPPFTFVINAIGKLEFRMKIMKPIGCVLFKQYLDHFEKHPGFFHAWSKHYIGIFFLNTEDFALAYYKDKVKHPTYIMTMLMGRSLVASPQSVRMYETFVMKMGLNRTDIFYPLCDDSCE
ncbi:von Ebner gland protein 2-like [Peromyscus maniculatus bairdii]|uniref:von Ebner gland protein 2-like n=1 Tax=Peromyscus maniculatus bairdii TaxID=230844 RepID=UPI003FD58C68